MWCFPQKKLPLPSPGKSGWPWTEESPQLPGVMPDGNLWPKISIVTPSYNQGSFIEETIRSVLLQGYPNLEYIIIDGGSTDKSVEIIKKYEKFLDYWISERDKGQAHAINKGLHIASGDVIAWINSDDVYTQNCFQIIAKKLWIGGKIIRSIAYGDCAIIDKEGKVSTHWRAENINTFNLIAFWRRKGFPPQPTVFIPGEIFKQNPLKESLHYAFDWELFLRLSQKYEFIYCNNILAQFRLYHGSKSSKGYPPFIKEQLSISKKYWGDKFFRHLYFRLDYLLSPLRLFFRIFPIQIRRMLKGCLGEIYYENAKRFLLKTHFFLPKKKMRDYP